MREIILATRGSRLALVQSDSVKQMLEALGVSVKIRVISTHGDRDRRSPLRLIGGKGLFVTEIEKELLAHRADIAVHSGKDLPYRLQDGLMIGGVPAASDPADCLLVRQGDRMPEHPVIATGSARRAFFVKRFLPEAGILEMRGNVDTRIRRLRDKEADGMILAAAGLKRLQPDLSGLKVKRLDPDRFIPAACQGILAVECRKEDEKIRHLLEQITDEESRRRLEAERFLMRLMQADCSMPVACYVTQKNGQMTMRGLFEDRIATESGSISAYREIAGRVAEKIYRNNQKC